VGHRSSQLQLEFGLTSSVQTATQTVGLAVLNSIMETYGFDPPEDPNAGELGVIGKTNAEFNTATLVVSSPGPA
jgi:hypothetical protein